MATDKKRRTTLGLATLFDGISPARFFHTYWPDRPLVVHGALERLGPLGFAPELQSVDRLLATHRGGAKVVFLTATGRYRQVEVQTNQAATLRESGLTLCIHRADASVRVIGRWVAALKKDLGLPSRRAWCNAYFSPAGEGFMKHFDDHEVIIVQIYGTKRWRIAPNEDIRFPSQNYVPSQGLMGELATYAQECSEQMPDDAETITMSPGSALFLPRGYWHTTAAQEDSLSLSFGCYFPTWIDVLLDDVRHRLIQRAEWREPAMTAARASAKRYHRRFGLLIEGLARDLRNLDPVDVLRGFPVEDRKAVRHSHQDGKRFQRNESAMIRIEALGGNMGHLAKVTIEAPDKETTEIEIDSELVALFQWVGRCDRAFTLGELGQAHPTLPKDCVAEALALADEAGLLVTTPPEVS
jgi:50S ribosomal protein L16 3-hydroxylase